MLQTPESKSDPSMSEMDFQENLESHQLAVKDTHLVKEEQQQQLERDFRIRYNRLKQVYEERLHQLYEKAASLYERFESDEILQTMRSDPMTAPFTKARTKEILADLFDEEREEQIERLAEKLVKKSSEYDALNRDFAILNSKLQQALLHRENTLDVEKEIENRVRLENMKIIAENEKISEELANLKYKLRDSDKEVEDHQKRYQKAKNMLGRLLSKQLKSLAKGNFMEYFDDQNFPSQWTDEYQSLDSLIEATTNGYNVLDKLFRDKQEELLQVKALYDEELKQMKLKIKQIENEKTNYASKELEIQQKLDKVVHENRQLHSDLEMANEKLRHAASASEKTETEKSALHNQYLLLSEKFNAFISDERQKERNRVVLLEQEIERLKSNEDTLKSTFQEQDREMTLLKKELDHKIKELEKAKAQISASEHLERRLQQMEQEKSQSVQEVNNLKVKYNNDLEQAKKEVDEEKRRLVDSTWQKQNAYLQKLKDWEINFTKKVEGSHKELKLHYEQLLKERNNEIELLKAENRMQQEAWKLQKKEEIQKEVDVIMSEYISKEEHQSLLKLQLQEELKNQVLTLSAQHKAELDTLQKTLESSRQKELAKLDSGHQKTLQELKAQFESSISELEEKLANERQHTQQLRQQGDAEAENKQSLLAQLRMATESIERLQKITDNQNDESAILKEELKNAKTKIVSLENEFTLKGALEKKLKDQSIRISELIEEVKGLSQQRDNLKFELEATGKENEDIKQEKYAEISLLREKLHKSNTATTKAEGRAQTLQDEVDRLQRTVQRLLNSNYKRKMQNRLKACLDESISLKRELFTLRSNIDSRLHDSLGMLKSASNELSIKIRDDFRDSKLRYHNELKNCRRNLQVVKMNAHKKDKVIEDLQERISQIQDKVEAEKEMKTSEIQIQMQRVNANMQRLESEKTEILKENEVLANQLHATKQAIESLDNKTMEYKKLMLEARGEVEKLKETNEVLSKIRKDIIELLVEVLELPQEIQKGLNGLDISRFESSIEVLHKRLKSGFLDRSLEPSSDIDRLQAMESAIEAQKEENKVVIEKLRKAGLLVKSLENEKAKLMKQLHEVKGEIDRLETKNKRVLEIEKSKYEEKLNHLNLLLQESEETRQLDEQEFEQRLLGSLAHLKEEQQLELEKLREEYERKERLWRSKFSAEKEHAHHLRDELNTTQKLLGEERSKISILHAERSFNSPLSIRFNRSAVEETYDRVDNRLLGRSWNASAQRLMPKETSKVGEVNSVDNLRELLSQSEALDEEIKSFEKYLSASGAHSKPFISDSSSPIVNNELIPEPRDKGISERFRDFKSEKKRAENVEADNVSVVLSPGKRNEPSPISTRLSHDDL